MSAATAERSTLSVDRELAGLPLRERTARLLEAAAAAGSDEERAAFQGQAIEINMATAAQLAARYRARGISEDDLRQVAYLALVKAVQRYEYAPDRDFMSFAIPTVRGELRRYFRDLGWTIRPTRRVQEAQAAIQRSEGQLCQQLGRSPRPSEIAEHLGLDLELVIEALSANGLFQPTSLDAVTPGETSLGDSLGHDEPAYGSAEARAALQPLLARLSDRERLMLRKRFFEDATQAEIGEALGVTQIQVSRMLSSLMARLRDEMIEE